MGKLYDILDEIAEEQLDFEETEEEVTLTPEEKAYRSDKVTELLKKKLGDVEYNKLGQYVIENKEKKL